MKIATGKTVDDVADYLVDELGFEASGVAELKRMFTESVIMRGQRPKYIESTMESDNDGYEDDKDKMQAFCELNTELENWHWCTAHFCIAYSANAPLTFSVYIF